MTMTRCYVCGIYDCETVRLPGNIVRPLCEECRVDLDGWFLASPEVDKAVELYECSLDNLNITLYKAKEDFVTMEAANITRRVFLKAEKELQILMTEMVDEMKRLADARSLRAKAALKTVCDCCT